MVGDCTLIFSIPKIIRWVFNLNVIKTCMIHLFMPIHVNAVDPPSSYAVMLYAEGNHFFVSVVIDMFADPGLSIL